MKPCIICFYVLCFVTIVLLFAVALGQVGIYERVDILVVESGVLCFSVIDAKFHVRIE